MFRIPRSSTGGSGYTRTSLSAVKSCYHNTKSTITKYSKAPNPALVKSVSFSSATQAGKESSSSSSSSSSTHNPRTEITLEGRDYTNGEGADQDKMMKFVDGKIIPHFLFNFVKLCFIDFNLHFFLLSMFYIYLRLR